MWIFLNNAFLSIVADKDGSELLVRARRRADLVRTFPGCKVKLTPPPADYRYRTVVTRERVGRVLAAEAASITYTNFKDSVPKSEHERHHAYLRVWCAMMDFQDGPRRRRVRATPSFYDDVVNDGAI